MNHSPLPTNVSERLADVLECDQLQEKMRIAMQLNRSLEMQTRLLASLIYDVRSPLTATGTFLRLLEERDRRRGSEDGLIVIAAKQFNQSLAVLHSLVEWGKLQDLRRSRNWPMINSRTLIAEVLDQVRRNPFSTHFTLADMHTDTVTRKLPEWEIQFILKLIIFWFCEIAMDGVISVHRINIAGDSLKAELRLASDGCSPNLPRQLEKLISVKSWVFGGNSPSEGLFLAIAQDILEDFNGNVRLLIEPGMVEALVEMDLGRMRKMCEDQVQMPGVANGR